MKSESPTERSLRARAAAFTRWAKIDDRPAATAAARTAARNRFEKQVDPDGVLTEGERTRRAEMARRAFYADMARKSVAARRRRKKAA
ncbi:hypothetical protein ACQPZX_41570 [Actinoplanes sp. CA-142083]|uniref:hypothetical protein n=1 Tax=Actinoplanes sp. CA-142083 TaxID=3239903 RepID=UPI003D8C1B0A